MTEQFYGDETASLDPHDWTAFRKLSHQMLDAACDLLESADSQRVWQPIPESIKESIRESLPVEPQGTNSVFQDIQQQILPYTLGNTHPRFFGWVHGSGTAGGMLAEMLAAAINANLGGREHAPVYIEQTVVGWMRQLFGFPASASGILVSGTSIANLIGIQIARDRVLGDQPRRSGLQGRSKRLVAYASSEAHSSLCKALETLGLGSDALRAIETDSQFRINHQLLEQQIRQDQQDGLQPFCIIGSAGTTNSGAIDDLQSLAQIAAAQKLWLHVDGAFGALAMLSPAHQNQLAGIEKADSLAFDFHKWLHVPYDAGCLLVRDGAAHRDTFSTRPAYLAESARGMSAAEHWFGDYGPELSRGFRALKVWFTIKEHGLKRLGQKVADNCRHAAFLAELIESNPRLQLLAPVSLNVVCFRFVNEDCNDEQLDRLNEELLNRLQESGLAAPSSTRIRGQFAIRVCITNHRTRMSDMQLVAEAVDELGLQLSVGHPSFETLQATSRETKQTATEITQKPLPPSLTSERVAAPILLGSMSKTQRSCLLQACRRPEIAPQIAGQTIEVVDEQPVPFQVRGPSHIAIAAPDVNEATVVAVMLRHALEIQLIRQVLPARPNTKSPTINQVATALLSVETAARYVHMLPPQERSAWQQSAPEMLRRVYEQTSQHCTDDLKLIDQARWLGHLLPLQAAAELDNQQSNDWSFWGAAEEAMQRYAPLATPVESLLCSGGDDRTELDVATGKNQYGIAPRPDRQLISLGSSTATTISTSAFQQAENERRNLWQQTAQQGDLRVVMRQAFQSVKRRLVKSLGLQIPRDGEVILTASGTDAEYIALHTALCHSGEPLMNIIIAPEESGSRLVRAARGQHHGRLTSMGTNVEQGTDLLDFPSRRVAVEVIDARDAAGELKSNAALESEIQRRTREFLQQGKRCLIHLLAPSKTGWTAPRLEFLLDLQRHAADRIDIVIDACQFRIDPAAIRHGVQAGCMVQLSGSKFFGAPLAAGALIVPSPLCNRLITGAPLPASLSHYTSQLTWPADWQWVAKQLSAQPNVGLLMRWHTALDEIERFNAVPIARRCQMIRDWGHEIAQAIDASETLCPVSTNPDQILAPQAVPADPRWDQWPTIFPFLIRLDDQFMSFDQATALHRRLAEDLSAALPAEATEAEVQAAAVRCQIGQPVKIWRAGRACGALRICIAARDVIAMHAESGSSSHQQRLRATLAKLEVTRKYFASLCGASTLRDRAPQNHSSKSVSVGAAAPLDATSALTQFLADSPVR